MGSRRRYTTEKGAKDFFFHSTKTKVFSLQMQPQQELARMLRYAKAAYEVPTVSRSPLNIFKSSSTAIEPPVQAAYYWDANALEDNEGAGKSDAQYYSIVCDDCIVYAIRGTSSWGDAIADARFFLSEFQDLMYSCGGAMSSSAGAEASAADVAAFRRGARVHSGFLAQYNSIKFSIVSTLFGHVLKNRSEYQDDEITSRHTSKRIVFVGHSLGGALATLAAAGTKALFPQLAIECFTFGSPRVGNAAFASYFDAVISKSVRCVHADDKVTKHPTLFYKHVGGELVVGAPSPSWFLGFFGSIEDHRLGKYEAAVGQSNINKIK